MTNKIREMVIFIVSIMLISLIGCANTNTVSVGQNDENSSEYDSEVNTDNTIHQIIPEEQQASPLYDLGYARYADEDMIQEAISLLEKVPVLIKQKGIRRCK